MKTKLTIVVLFLLMSVGIVQGQESTISSNAIYAEKIYLQTDAPLYLAEDRLWFTSTVLGADRTPSKISGLLHVDLMDVKGKILKSRKLKLAEGRAHGFFDLLGYAPGPYRLRAYTHWNRNFGAGFYATRQFDIQTEDAAVASLAPITDIYLTALPSGERSLSGRISDYIADSLTVEKLSVEMETASSKNTLTVFPGPSGFVFNDRLPAGEPMATVSFMAEDKTKYEVPVMLDPDYVDLQFYPEGGVLVNGIRSRVGFRATDAMGRPKVVKGQVVDNEGKTVVAFQSNQQGMGSFFLTPDESELKAQLSQGEDDPVLFDLPKAKNDDHVLYTEQREDGFWVSVEGKNEGEALTLELSSKGQKYFGLAGKLVDGRFVTRLDRSQLPDGIIELKLLDAEQNRLATRLVFHQNPSDALNVSVTTNRPKANQRDRTDLELTVTDAAGNAVSTTGNLYVINKEQLGDYYHKDESIVSRLLLTSELKSAPQNPGVYFDKGKANKEEIDHLLLTTNYTDYLYSMEIGELTMMPEKGLSVTGKVTGKLNKKRGKARVDLMLMTFGSETNVYNQKTDDEGRFGFQLDDEYGEYMKLLFQSKRRGEKSDLKVMIDDYEAPEASLDVNQLMLEPDTIITRLARKNQERKQIRDAFGFSERVTDLGEVVVEDYLRSPQRQKMMRWFGKPTLSIPRDELLAMNQKWSSGLYSIFRHNIREIRIVQRTDSLGAVIDVAEVPGADVTIIMVDGLPVHPFNYPFLPNLNPNDIQAVDFTRDPPGLSRVYFEIYPQESILPETSAMISIYTVSGTGIWGGMKPKGMNEARIGVLSPSGVYTGREYQQLTQQDWVIPDYRAMIHWDPVFNTDKEGQYKTSFYNADIPGDMLVVVEVVSENGQVGYAELSYEVLNQRRRVNAREESY